MRWRLALCACLLAGLVFPLPASALGPSGLRARLARDMSHAGRYSGAYVMDLTTHRTLFTWRGDVGRSPASVEKLYTTTTALLRFGPTATFTTALEGTAVVDPDGIYRGNLWLHGDGDPSLTTARLAQMAAQVRALGITSIHGAIIGDETKFDGLRGSYDSRYGLDGDIGELGGLVVNEGFDSHGHFQFSPARYAAQQLVAALKRAGVKVTGGTRRGVAPANAQPLVASPSAPLGTLVAMTNTPSDNFFAETFVKDIGAAFGGAGSTPAGTAVIRAQMAQFANVHPVIVDGSGLSRVDHTTPHQVVKLLNRLNGNTTVGPVLRASLPIAGRTGTLDTRMRHTLAEGRCQAKTGSLIGVSGLAGYCPSRDGHTIAFAFLMNSLSVYTARSIQDGMTVALANATLGG